MPRKRVGPGFSGDRAVDIGVLLERVLKKNHIGEDMDFRTLSERFSEVVGEAVSAHVELVKLDRRTLVLKASSSAWKSELFLQKNAIIDRCNTMLGKPAVQFIRFV